MTLTKEEQEQVLQKVMEFFTKKEIERMDEIFLDFDDIRVNSKSTLEFLSKIKERYEDHNILIAALLYGIKVGELGYDYQKKCVSKLPEFGHAS